MQSNTPLPIDSFLFDFPVDIVASESRATEAVEAPSRESAQALVQSDNGDMVTSGSGDGRIAAPSQSHDTSTYDDVVQTGARGSGVHRGGHVERDHSGRTTASTTMQDTTVQSEGPIRYRTHSNYDNATTSSRVELPNLVQSQPGSYGPHGSTILATPSGYAQHNYAQTNSGLPAERYNVHANAGLSTGPLPLDDYNYTQPSMPFPPNGYNPVQPSTPSEQFRGGDPSALVVITGMPAFNIPIDLATALRNMFPH